jgi:hypothetical protein
VCEPLTAASWSGEVESAGPVDKRGEEDGGFPGVAKLGAGERDGACPLRFTVKPRW